ncbi:MAG: hypothetical protein UZ14_CFX002000945 [Chloroflexi bacterium OLB14]|nr:MAG: hypothetical protein UZ14_CFX002000945 [Chloroflexi bacterium OLB14]
MKTLFFIINIILASIYLLFSWKDYGTILIYIANASITFLIGLMLYSIKNRVDYFVILLLFIQILFIVFSMPFRNLPATESPNIMKIASLAVVFIMYHLISKTEPFNTNKQL